MTTATNPDDLRTEWLNLKVSPREREMAKALAQRDGRTMSDVIRGLLRREHRKIEATANTSATK